MREQNPLSPLFSYCPSIPPPCAPGQRSTSNDSPPPVFPPFLSEAESRGASVPTFSALMFVNVSQPKSKCACVSVIRLIHFPVMNENPYGEKRTSCVLWPPRILTDAR